MPKIFSNPSHRGDPKFREFRLYTIENPIGYAATLPLIHRPQWVFLPRWFEKAGTATSWWKGGFLERCPPSVEVGAVSFSGFGGATKKNQESEKNLFIHHFDAYFFENGCETV